MCKNTISKPCNLGTHKMLGCTINLWMGTESLQSSVWNTYMWLVTRINFVLVISLHCYALQHLVCHPKHLVLALSKTKAVIKWTPGTFSVLNFPLFL